MSKRVNKREFRRAVLDRVCDVCEHREAEQFVQHAADFKIFVACADCTKYRFTGKSAYIIVPLEDFHDTFQAFQIQETLLE